MASHALLIEVRFHDGRYHGRDDWPPSPFRLFQALIAGAYGGRWANESPKAKDDAFHWLERLDPPHIVAPRSDPGAAVAYFVPNNDLDAKGGDPLRVSEIRARKNIAPRLFDRDLPILYAWPFDRGEVEAATIARLAERLHTLGLGLDAAFARAEIIEWRQAEARLVAHGGTIARPSGPAVDGLTCPMQGSLDSLKERHADAARRFRRDGKTTLYSNQRKARARTIAYGRAPEYVLFDLVPGHGERRFHRVAIERAVELGLAVRMELADRLGESEEGLGVGVLPLPSIGSPYADGVRRVAVEIPPDCRLPVADVEWALSGRALQDFGGARLTPAEDRRMLRHYGVEPAASARRWVSVTPLALPAPSTKRPVRTPVSGEERAVAEARLVASVATALRRAGVDPHGAEIRVQNEPPHSKGQTALNFRRNSIADHPLRHVNVIVARNIDGPLVLDDGSCPGLGLLRPVELPPEPFHVFALAPEARCARDQREAILRAFRRAAMARAARLQPREDALPRFFSGHEPDGSPARSGRHRHLYYLADDADGDGLIDRVAVVAPRCMDGDMDELAYRRRLALAMVGFAEFRDMASRACAIVREAPAADDPIFGRGRVWVSRTVYRATRHPQRGADGCASLCADVAAECSRHGLPRPKVEIVDHAFGPRGGLRARVRLHFGTCVAGPLLLGANSHFGSGLFGLEG